MSILLIMLVYGIPLSLVLSALLLTMIRSNPRLMLQDYPKDIHYGAAENPHRTAPDTLLGGCASAPGARFSCGSRALRKGNPTWLPRDLSQRLWSSLSVQCGRLADSRLAHLLHLHSSVCGASWNGRHGRIQKLRHALQRISDWNSFLSNSRCSHRSHGHLCLDGSSCFIVKKTRWRKDKHEKLSLQLFCEIE